MQPNVMRLGRVWVRTGIVPRKRLSMPALLARPRGALDFPGIDAAFAMAGILQAGFRPGLRQTVDFELGRSRFGGSAFSLAAGRAGDKLPESMS